MIFNSDELDAIATWAATAKPLKGIYYRSVEYRYMDPKEVLSGRGAALYGGRFASVGTPAVFLAESDGGASGEVLARKQRLGGNAQITLDKYPRVVFGSRKSRMQSRRTKNTIGRWRWIVSIDPALGWKVLALALSLRRHREEHDIWGVSAYRPHGRPRASLRCEEAAGSCMRFTGFCIEAA